MMDVVGVGLGSRISLKTNDYRVAKLCASYTRDQVGRETNGYNPIGVEKIVMWQDEIS